MRLFYCNACATADEVPNYELKGKDDVDPYVEALQLRHVEGNPMKHGVGNPDMIFSPFRVVAIMDKDGQPVTEWESPEARKNAIDQLNQSNKEVGFDGWVYDSHSTFKEDAMKCYNQHRRPKQGCIDWRDESKLLGHPTDLGQKLSKEMPGLAKGGPCLCDFCPVKVWVETEQRHRKGLYKG